MQLHPKSNSIVIVGGGTAGWLAAAVLCKSWKPGEGPAITVVESPRRAGAGVTELSCHPALGNLMSYLGVEESDWMSKCRATYKINVCLVGWNGLPKGQDTFRHPLYCFGEDDNPDLLRHWLHARSYEGFQKSFDTCFLSVHLAQAYKAPKLNAQDRGRLRYAYHVDLERFAEYLKEWSCQHGVQSIIDNVREVCLDQNGDIDHLKTHKSGDLFAETFIDCTGFLGLLISKTLEEPFISYADQVFCDAAIAVSAYPSTWAHQIPPETTTTALSAGWCWEIPLSDRLGAGYVYSSHHLSRDEAERELRAHLGPDVPQDEARYIPMRVGRTQRAWVKNCVSIGLSASFIEPLEATSLFMIQYGIAQFVMCLRQYSDVATRRDEYNMLMRDVYEGILDFILMHYYLNGREDTDFWKANRHRTTIPDSLHYLLDTWRSGQDFDPVLRQSKSARFVQLSSWYTLLLGLQYFPGLGSLTHTAAPKDYSRSGYLHHQIHDLAEAAAHYPTHTHLLSSLGTC